MKFLPFKWVRMETCDTSVLYTCARVSCLFIMLATLLSWHSQGTTMQTFLDSVGGYAAQPPWWLTRLHVSYLQGAVRVVLLQCPAFLRKTSLGSLAFRPGEGKEHSVLTCKACVYCTCKSPAFLHKHAKSMRTPRTRNTAKSLRLNRSKKGL